MENVPGVIYSEPSKPSFYVEGENVNQTDIYKTVRTDDIHVLYGVGNENTNMFNDSMHCSYCNTTSKISDYLNWVV